MPMTCPRPASWLSRLSMPVPGLEDGQPFCVPGRDAHSGFRTPQTTANAVPKPLLNAAPR